MIGRLRDAWLVLTGQAFATRYATGGVIRFTFDYGGYLTVSTNGTTAVANNTGAFGP